MTSLKANPLLDAATVLVGWTNRSATCDTEKIFTSGEVVKLNTKLVPPLSSRCWCPTQVTALR
jgi:hypothetical protein